MKYLLFTINFFLLLIVSYAQQPGTFDGDFDSDGVGFYYVPDYTGGCLAYATAIQPDGKILIAGTSAIDNNAYGNVTIMRLNPDGAADEWFGNQLFWNSTGNYFSPMGFTLENAMVVSNTAKAIALLPNGDIITGATYFTNDGFAIQNFGTSGYLNSNFGSGDGTVVTNLGTSATFYALVVQPDGKIIAAGDASNGIENTTFALVRYDTSGNEDATFSFDGIVTTALGFSYGSSARTVAVQPDGKIIAAGHYGAQCALVRYLANGNLDNTFGSSGKVITAVGDESIINAIALQPDGKIVAAGYSTSFGFQGNYTLIRYNANGTLDASFGVGGIATVSDGMFNGVAIQPDGKIVATGSRLSSQTLDLIRFNANGTRDNTFGIQGIAYPVYGAEGRAIAIQPDGKIVVTGYSVGGTPNWKFCVARYLSGFNVGVVNPLNPATETLFYPNPVNTEAVFELELETATQLSLSVYDITGRLLQQPLSNAYMLPGKHQIPLSLTNLSAGTYLLLLQAGSHTITTQFVKQ